MKIVALKLAFSGADTSLEIGYLAVGLDRGMICGAPTIPKGIIVFSLKNIG